MIDSTPLSPKARHWLRELDPAVQAQSSVSKNAKNPITDDFFVLIYIPGKTGAG